MKPDAAYHNNLGLALIKAGQAEEGKAELQTAAGIGVPANGGRYYFNLGAVMVNSGNAQGAIDAFRKATEVQPDHADAYYQLATALVGTATMKEDGSIVPAPGTVSKPIANTWNCSPPDRMPQALKRWFRAFPARWKPHSRTRRRKRKSLDRRFRCASTEPEGRGLWPAPFSEEGRGLRTILMMIAGVIALAIVRSIVRDIARAVSRSMGGGNRKSTAAPSAAAGKRRRRSRRKTREGPANGNLHRPGRLPLPAEIDGATHYFESKKTRDEYLNAQR